MYRSGWGKGEMQGNTFETVINARYTTGLRVRIVKNIEEKS